MYILLSTNVPVLLNKSRILMIPSEAKARIFFEISFSPYMYRAWHFTKRRDVCDPLKKLSDIVISSFAHSMHMD